MSELIFIVEEAPEGGFTARALGHSIFTEGETMEELRQQVRDAVQCHFDEGKAPRVIRLQPGRFIKAAVWRIIRLFYLPELFLEELELVPDEEEPADW